MRDSIKTISDARWFSETFLAKRLKHKDLLEEEDSLGTTPDDDPAYQANIKRLFKN